MRPLFADPKTDFVFKKIFGSEEQKPLLIAFLNHLLELDEAHRIVSIELLSPEQRPHVSELKNSIVDVKCADVRGTRYVVETQVLNVEGFEKRVVYNVAKAYTGQLDAGQRYPELNDIVGVTICDFELWPRRSGAHVPMLSRWPMQEQHDGALGLGQLQFVFLELPKFDTSRPPQSVVERWAYFFREAGNLDVVPEVLAERPFLDALEAARVARFTDEEWDAYIRAGMAIQDERGALSLARKQGIEVGIEQGRRSAVRTVLSGRGIALGPEEEARLQGARDRATLERWLQQALTAPTATEALR
ncbi:Rpn family recombination-promoting nuclease/putative transposase [Sorangium sp. So ce134]